MYIAEVNFDAPIMGNDGLEDHGLGHKNTINSFQRQDKKAFVFLE